LRAVFLIAQLVLVLGLVGGLALALGWVSRFVFVVLLGGVFVGLLAGALTGFFGIISSSWTRRVQHVSIGLAVLVGFASFQFMDDVHHITTFRMQVALAVYADSGASGTDEIGEEELTFFARGADGMLARSMVASVGEPGALGRWLHRVDGGVRTFGSWEQRRVIPVGRELTLLFLLFDLGVSAWVGLRVNRRIGENAEAALDSLERNAEELDDEGEQNDSTTG
jgi:hypothetical protein